MINSAETQPPIISGRRQINPSETLPPENHNAGDSTIILSPGESVADSYIVNSLMEKQGKQSNVYLAKKWGKTYVVKVYRNGWHPSNQLKSFLTNIRHPNIANIIECGERDGHYYEIYDYYTEGTLENSGALPSLLIQNVVVPSINEGLLELHKNGIVHCDIKPSNLFYADDKKRIVIGDCGISGYTNSKGKLVDSVRGTPEYAPRVRSLLWSAAMSPAYDYGSFGLVLCRLVLGHSLFHGMSVEEIANAWEEGLQLPSQINGRIGLLIKGLLNDDEEQRWGYVQVKRWCEGEFMRTTNRSIYARTKKEAEKKPLIYGRFDGQTLAVHTLHQLELAIVEHWDQATRIVKRRELQDFIRQFDQSLTNTIRELSLYQDANAAAYKLLTYISDDPTVIIYKGKRYGTLAEYVEQLSYGKDELAKQFLSSGLLIFYLRHNEYEKAQVDKLEALIRRQGTEDMSAITTICYTLQGKRTVDVFGETVDSLDQLIPVLYRHTISEIDELLRTDRFIAWLNRLGYEKEMRKMKEAFSK